MLIVNNRLLDVTKKEDPAVAFYLRESAKILKLKEPIVIERIDKGWEFRDGRKRKRRPVPISTNWIFRGERGTEEWIICDTYSTDAKTMILKPNRRMFGVDQFMRLHPEKDVEMIFYMTCIVNLAKVGLKIQNEEAEARVLNAEEAEALDVKFFILSEASSVSLDDLRLIGQAWGIMSADKMPEALFRRALLDRVNADEKNKLKTKRGFKEFTDDVKGLSPEMLEARIVANMTLSKGVIGYEENTRKLTYSSTGEHLAIVPIDDMERKADFLAALFLKKPEVFETAVHDVEYKPADEPVSVAEVEIIEPTKENRPKLMDLAKRAKMKFSVATKTENLKTKLIEHLKQNVV